MGGIFISYRREDSIAYAGRLYDRLQTHFGKEQVFMDVDTLKPGEDFVDKLQSAVASCDVLIAIIGPHWLTEKDHNGEIRLLSPEDFVHLEIVAALERGIRVIPALVGGAHMPLSTSLPDPLKKLARRQAITIQDIEFHQSVSSLIESLESAIKENQEQHRKRIKADTTQAPPLRQGKVALPNQVEPQNNTSVAGAKTGKATSSLFALPSVPMPVLLACIVVVLTIAIYLVWPTGRSNDQTNLTENTPPVLIPPEKNAVPPVADEARKGQGSVGKDQASPPRPSEDQSRSAKPSDTAEKSEAVTRSRNPQRIRVGGNVIATNLISQVKPIYPTLAKETRVEGMVILEAEIDKDGSIENLKVISGHPLLVQAAIDAVKQWRYKPTMMNGEAVAVVTTISVNFAFSSDSSDTSP
jgi:TonB family protein